METYPPVVDDFIRSLKKHTEHVKKHPSIWSYEIAEADPEYAVPLVRAIIANELSLKQWTFLGALRFVPVDDLTALANYALANLVHNPANEPAAYVVTFVSQEFPHFLHPHLRVILELCEHAALYDAVDAWRGADIPEVLYLKDVYEAAGEGTRLRDFALRALLETHDQIVLQQLVASVSEVYLLETGYEVKDGMLQKLFPDTAFHLRFPDGYPDPSASWVQKMHPTWHLPLAQAEPLALGGMVEGTGKCRSCGETIHHLLTLAPIPEGIGVTGLASPTVAVCLSCLGVEAEMGIVFYKHDYVGMPVEHIGFDGPQVVPQFPVEPLQPITVHLAVTPVPWCFQHWSDRENIFRIGGHPAWVQTAEYPRCPVCAQTMPFLLQFDSDLSVVDTPYHPYVTGWLWGSGGVAYVHWCDTCRISSVHWQST